MDINGDKWIIMDINGYKRIHLTCNSHIGIEWKWAYRYIVWNIKFPHSYG